MENSHTRRLYKEPNMENYRRWFEQLDQRFAQYIDSLNQEKDVKEVLGVLDELSKSFVSLKPLSRMLGTKKIRRYIKKTQEEIKNMCVRSNRIKTTIEGYLDHLRDSEQIPEEYRGLYQEIRIRLG